MVSGTDTVHRISPSTDGKGHLTRIALDKSVSPDIHFSELKSDFFFRIVLYHWSLTSLVNFRQQKSPGPTC